MPPDGALLARSRTALALWETLRAAYDDIGAALAAPESHDLATLGARIVGIEAELKPLVAELAAARSRGSTDAELLELWHATDALVASLAERHPALVRAALDARSATAERLTAHRLAHGYGAGSGQALQLTSRHA